MHSPAVLKITSESLVKSFFNYCFNDTDRIFLYVLWLMNDERYRWFSSLKKLWCHFQSNMVTADQDRIHWGTFGIHKYVEIFCKIFKNSLICHPLFRIIDFFILLDFPVSLSDISSANSTIFILLKWAIFWKTLF